MACSTRARIFAWDRFTACRPVERVSHRPQHGVRTVPSAPGSLIGPARDVGLGEGTGDAVLTVRADVVDRAGQGR